MLVVGNWKMNGSAALVGRWVKEWNAAADRLNDAAAAGGAAAERAWAEWTSVDKVVCPPFPFVGALWNAADLTTGAQDCSAAGEAGARTGEVAAAMLAEFGCQYVLVGHSERRRFFGEDGEVCGAKMRAALAAGLAPILCVGETAEERARGATAAVVRGQLAAALAVLRRDGISPLAAVPNSSWKELVVGYEPVWAIGTGRTPAVAEIVAAHAAIRNFLRESGFDGEKCAIIRILYGGSVGASSAAEIFAADGVDGALVGGASLRAAEFARICRAAGKQTETETQTETKTDNTDETETHTESESESENTTDPTNR